MDPKYFRHTDFYLCAFLLVKNCKLIKQERIGNSTTFTFEDSDVLRQQTSNYYSLKGTVDAASYAATIRTLKSMIHMNKKSESILTSISENLNHEFNNKQQGTK